jgi:hypothetical protein
MGETSSPSVVYVGYDISPLSRVKPCTRIPPPLPVVVLHLIRSFIRISLDIENHLYKPKLDLDEASNKHFKLHFPVQ